jgi:hypothetical protein
MPQKPTLKLASATAQLERSLMRELLAYAVDPNVISLHCNTAHTTSPSGAGSPSG